MSSELHQFEQTLYSGSKFNSAKSAMILVHGRGDDATKMQQLSQQLELPSDMAIVYPVATNNTWYPKGFMEEWSENQPWLDSALANLNRIILELNKSDVPTDKIFLLGFSQGACLSLEYATRNAKRYAGIAVLSGGLIGPFIEKKHYDGNFKGTEILIGCSDIDHHIPESRLHESDEVVSAMGAKVDKRIYPGMDHLINDDEIKKVNKMISTLKK